MNREQGLLALGVVVGFIAGAFMGNVSPVKQTVPEKPCCTCGYTVIEKGVHVNNCGDTVIVEKFKFDKQFNSQN